MRPRERAFCGGRGSVCRNAPLRLEFFSMKTRADRNRRGWSIIVGISCLLGLGLAGLLQALQHAPVAAGARETTANELQQDLQKGGKRLVIDVRSPKEYAQGHVPGAINVPFEGFQKKIEEMKVPKDTTIVTVCDHGGRSSRAAVELQKLGYKTSSFCRLDSWKKEGYKLERGRGKD